MSVDAVVVGAGPNGLVAANLLADRGWDVVVLEANDEPGGAVRTAEVTAPGFRNDLFSAFYPFAAASPVMRDLDLGSHGLRWTHAPSVLAHPRLDRPAAVLHRELDDTARSLDDDHPGDGAAFRRLMTEWGELSDPLLHALLSPFPPLRHGARLIAAAGMRGAFDLARRGVLPLRRFVDEQFDGENAALLFAGCALHADIGPEAAGSALFGWMLLCLGQQVGFPVPVGGAAELTAALVRRLERKGGQVRCGARVERILVRNGCTTGVRIVGGEQVQARRAVIADCDAATLYLDLVAAGDLPGRVMSAARRIQRGEATFKVDWALDGPIPWDDPNVVGAGTVHIADSLSELTTTSAQLANGLVPSDPFVLLGQMTTADPTRSPPGTASVWAYTHLPQRVTGDAGATGESGIRGDWSRADVERMTERIERRIEEHAPGFRDRIIARHCASPPDLEAADANLVGGDIGGGTAQPYQQLVFRPLPGLGRAETPIRGLYLGSSSAHPGGGVHGACGANAAKAAIAHDRLRRWTFRRPLDA